MKSDIYLEDELYRIIKSSAIASAIDGDIYQGPDERPDNSDKEDVEIIVIANQNAQIQKATISINIYTKDLNIDGQMRRNRPRLRLFQQYLDALFGPVINISGYRLSLESTGVYTEHKVNQHYVNAKLKFQFFNN